VKYNMKIEELKELFNKYSIDTLDSLGLLIGLVNTNHMENVLIAYKYVYDRKFLENNEDYEGMNEYDDICMLLNFNMTEVLYNLNKLNNKELEFIISIAEKALMVMECDTKKYSSMITELEVLLDRCRNGKAILPSVETLDEEFTIKELEYFFRKYTYAELAYMNIIFDYTFGYEIDRIKKVYSKVLKEKDDELRANFESPNFYTTNSIYSLASENFKLKDKELEMFDKLLEAADMCLSSINYLDIEDDLGVENREAQDERVQISKLYDSIEEEIKDRKTNEFIKMMIKSRK